MTDAPQAPTQTVRPPGRTTPQWLVVTIVVFFGLFFAYDMWEAIGNLVGLNLAAQGLDTQLSAFGWAVLIAGVVLPVLVFGIAFWLGRHRGAVARAILFLAGLGLIAALSLDIFMFGLGSLIV